MDVALGEIDRAVLTITTDEPAQAEVVAVRLNALNATPGNSFEISLIDKNGVPRADTFPPGSDTTRNIAPPARSNFMLGQRQKPGGEIVSVLLQPEYTFRRL